MTYNRRTHPRICRFSVNLHGAHVLGKLHFECDVDDDQVSIDTEYLTPLVEDTLADIRFEIDTSSIWVDEP